MRINIRRSLAKPSKRVREVRINARQSLAKPSKRVREVRIKKMTTLRTEEMTLNMGPQHPSTHGVLRFVIKADGEVMREAIPDVGYLHRSIEKIAEKVGYHGFMPYTDRVDYVCAMFTNQGWGMACEKLAGIEVPRRGEYCRLIAAEFNRIASHLLTVGLMGMDIGAMTPFLHALRDMVVELVVETHGIAARILPDFGKKQTVESGAFGACLAASGFRHQSLVILRERHAFEA